jgi:hypothetical protein
MESGLPRLECEAYGRIASIIREIHGKWVIFNENFGFSAKIHLRKPKHNALTSSPTGC